jgi:DNA helicase II / ATP-dependent DNA helicase PcrA
MLVWHSMSVLDGLNMAQQQAVTSTEGPVLILAGAGSGKTKALTHRFAYLLQEKNQSPLHILCVTFTNKAAKEMAERVHRLLGTTAQFPFLGTFHSVCVRILRRELSNTGLGFPSSFSIFDETDSLTAVKRAMQELQIDSKAFHPQAVRNAISGAKNELLSPVQYEQYALGMFQQVVHRVYQRYAALLQSAGAVDFDDILTLTVRLFQEYPDIRKQYQQRFHYIMVDEYQDTNRAQYTLIRILAEQRRNIFVIGDDWQSVYSWRGADFRNILDFERDYPDATVIKLEQNYRSTKTILEAATAVIRNNQQRSEKQLWTAGPQGVPITAVECLNEKDEAEFIIREATSLVRGRLSPSVHSLRDMVVLYRTNAQSRVIEETCIRYGLPYKIVGGTRFYDRKEIKDVLAYLKLMVNSNDWVSFERVVNVPPRGIGEKTVAQVRHLTIAEQRTHPKVGQFWHIVAKLTSQDHANASEAIKAVITATGLEKYVDDGSIEGQSRWENIRELQGVAEEGGSLEEFLEQVALVQDGDIRDSGEGVLTLMTMHAAKGLEFPVVFLAGMEENIFPSSRSSAVKSELEEERRLAYVAITRAKERLYFLSCFERRIYGLLQSNPPSRFLGEVPDHLKESI